MDKGEQEIRRKMLVDEIIEWKCDELKNKGIKELAQPNTDFEVIEDFICAMGLSRYGYGFWELIKNDIRNEPSLMFDWVARSRTVTDI